MSQYFLILVWLGIAALITGVLKQRRTETVPGTTEYRYNPIWAILIFLPIFIMAGLRERIGDTGTYRHMFLNFPASFAEIIPYLKSDAGDKGFGVLTIFLKTFIGDNHVLYFFIIAGIQSFCMIKVCRKYSESYLLSIFMFVASAAYISWMFNGIRQFLAAAMTFACTGFIFYIIKEPTDADPTAVVTAGSTTYTGAVNTPVSSSWSFTDTSKNAVVNLVDANTLTVTTSTSYMTSTTETVPVTQIHDDYGIVMLEANQVAGDVTKEPEASVAGDSDEELPQTGGISNSTLIGIFGLALISIGGTAFIIYRKKFLN